MARFATITKPNAKWTIENQKSAIASVTETVSLIDFLRVSIQNEAAFSIEEASFSQCCDLWLMALKKLQHQQQSINSLLLLGRSVACAKRLWTWNNTHMETQVSQSVRERERCRQRLGWCQIKSCWFRRRRLCWPPWHKHINHRFFYASNSNQRNIVACLSKQTPAEVSRRVSKAAKFCFCFFNLCRRMTRSISIFQAALELQRISRSSRLSPVRSTRQSTLFNKTVFSYWNIEINK